MGKKNRENISASYGTPKQNVESSITFNTGIQEWSESEFVNIYIAW